ncbi:MAG: hypothetical protein R3C60_13555 [Parvularculaceae bacterium]
MAEKKTQIVIAGGGAGGLELAARLGRALGREKFDIILLERERTHIWKPLLHEVAAGSLDANLDEVGYRSHGKQRAIAFSGARSPASTATAAKFCRAARRYGRL